MIELSRRKMIIHMACLVLIWGLCWPIYKFTLSYTPPLLYAGMRALIGGVLLSILCFPKRKSIRWSENWRIYCVSALFNTVLFFGLQTIGLMYLPGGLFSVIVYLQPVLIGVFAWVWLGETMSAIKVIGLVIGFLGVGAVSTGSISGQVSLLGVALAIITAISWTLGVIYVKKVSPKVDSLWLVALQSVLGGVVLTGMGLGAESWSDIVWNSTYIFGLVFGSTLGIPVAYILYFKLLNSGETSKVASSTFLVPLIAVLFGTSFLGEPFTLSLFIGLILIASSIYLVNRPKKSEPKYKHTTLQEKI
ncbi:DMT family transporter [Peribacillus asahii]|uniref:DMT family transporter n=1 Tax=Peribacillus asahii TaxID=228899 RepID=UPI00207A92EF|nr:DMT family transporter [Peribacillus asahii]USK58434.1 DMT family transporter [Peribacillus asahii]